MFDKLLQRIYRLREIGDPANGYLRIPFIWNVDVAASVFDKISIAAGTMGGTGSEANLAPLGNQRIELRTVSANKNWVGGSGPRPTIWFRALFRMVEGGIEEPVPLAQAPIKRLDDGTTEVTWQDIEGTDAQDNIYTFRVREVDENGDDFTPEHYSKVEEGLFVTNTIKEGKILIDKVVLFGNAEEIFQFTVTKIGTEVTYDAELTSEQDPASLTLPEGKYSVIEIKKENWKQASVECASNIDGKSQLNTGISLEENEIVTCVFTNRYEKIPDIPDTGFPTKP